MNSKLNLLVGIFVLQVLIVAVLMWGGNNAAPAASWLNFERGSLTRIQISDAQDSIDLQRSADGWLIDELPADTAKVDGVLDKLEGIDAAWPTATSGSAAERFEVSGDNFQRRVQLLVDDRTVADFFLGTSPGYQRVHARAAESDDIYSVALSNYELPLRADDWLDKSLLAVSELPTSIRVTFADQRVELLEQGAEGWLYNGAAANQDTAVTYANRFKTLRVLGRATDPGDVQQLAEIELQGPDGQRVLRISRQMSAASADADADANTAAEGDYYLSDGDRTFSVATYIAEQLLLSDVDLAPAVGETTAPTDDPAAAIDQVQIPLAPSN